MQPAEIGDLYRNTMPGLCGGAWKEWRGKYLAFVDRIRRATREEWMTPKFQEYLWESDDLSGVGMGSSVVLTTAYADREVAEALWEARERSLPTDVASRGDVIATVFEDTLKLITPKHNKRRPSAKLVRALAAIFPRDVLCLLDDYKTKQVRGVLGLKKQGEHFLRQHVRLREELKKLVGPEETIEDSVERSMFAWLLYERAVNEEEQAATGVGTPSILPAGPQGQPAAPPLRLLPRDQQYLGISHVQDALRLINTIVRDAEHGITRKDLVANVQAEAPYLNAKSAGMQIGVARERLGLLELHDGDIFRPTSLGRELLEGESASNVLAPIMLRRIWGFAQLLDALRTNAEGLGRNAIGAELRRRHGSWTTDMTASAILEWCRDLELVDQETQGGQLVFWLSDSGVQWASRLPSDLKAWDAPAKADAVATTDAVEVELLSASAEEADRPLIVSNFDAVASQFATDAALAKLVLPADLLGLLHGALHAMPHKRFVLLAGLSGTGKTSLAEAYARAYCAASKVPARDHMIRVSVSPDWSDPSGLLGYISPLGAEPTFQGTHALELVLLASRNPEKPYFLCLDEMNLARVEHYFAPFLSAMEGERAYLFLHGSRDAVDNVPSKILWPRNLFIIGTVNMDETTHAFSDKVLDRAFSFELWDVDLATWRTKAREAGAAEEAIESIYEPLVALYGALRPARRHFGYRTCDEILGFCSAVPPSLRAAALDAAVLAKILPKIRGDDSGALPGALEAAAKVCEVRGLARSAEKIAAMRDSLRTLGVVRFSS